ncbi:secreted protein [Candidatus Omnitrophus magneticus]|uniref:Secreted protein n=1 Tax=Candidatus Omnitrophus magneticus TaxID=1609969 RepID=A0A0F0CNS7_9BACT|nr:secreted protein [Candidatus Omnitrophus magneticus]
MILPRSFAPCIMALLLFALVSSKLSGSKILFHFPIQLSFTFIPL